MEAPYEIVNAILNAFESNKRTADRAIEQLSDEQLRQPLDEHTNSVAIIMKHIAGNLISRWTDFLTTDGEKPDRNRDDEFVDSFGSRVEILERWEQGWQCLFDSLEGMTPRDLEKVVEIRGVPHSVPLAMTRSLGHTCYHIGQIVLIARHLAGDNWTTISIAKGGSDVFNKENWGKG